MPVLNSRILKTSKNKNVEVFVVGTPADLSYPFQHLGANADILNSLRDGKHPLCEKIKSKKHPLMIVGKDALTRSDGEAILKTTKMIAN